MRRLHLFNCSNDLALAQGSKGYIAPKSAIQMERDLAPLPWWWANEGDAVLLPQEADRKAAEEFFAPHKQEIIFITEDEGYDTLRKRAGCDFSPSPWGWSHAAAERFRRIGMPDTLLPDERSIDTMRTLSSREFASEYIVKLLNEVELSQYRDILAGDKMRFIKNLKELQTPERTIFKSPWSSSGRGVFAANSLDEPSIREKLTGFITRQGGFIADKLYNKESDFALEYYISSDGKAHFLGYSVFTAGANGYYGHNIIAPQETLKKIITDSGCPEELLTCLTTVHRTLLTNSLKGLYSGVVGIDMLTAREKERVIVHPCIEINLRMNMGVLAMMINKRIKETTECRLLPPYKRTFDATVKDSRLHIAPINSRNRERL